MDPYVDFWLAETLSLVAEARAAYEATKESGKAFWVAFTPDDSSASDSEKVALRSGETLEEAMTWAVQNGAEALLFNCARPEYMAYAIDAANSVSSKPTGSARPPLGVYANAFEPRSNGYAANADVAPTDDKLNVKVYSDFAAEWVAKGADIVGGCCGIGHEHVRELARSFKDTPVA